MPASKLLSSAIVFVTSDIEKTANYYHDVAGFRVVPHYDLAEKFAALYRDGVEIVLVQARHGTVRSNQACYGAGYDAYLVPETLEGVTGFYEEIEARGAKIVRPPTVTAYGSLEFVFEDIDGRQIGVGLIKDNGIFFGDK